MLISVSKRQREPLMCVHEMGKYISGMNNKKSSGPDKICSQLLKLASPYIAGSVIYIINLCIEQNVFPSEFQIKLFLCPKLDITKIWMIIVQSHYCRFCLNFWKDGFSRPFSPTKSRFIRKHICNTALGRLTDSRLSAIHRSDLSGDVFLDFKKASWQNLTFCLFK